MAKPSYNGDGPIPVSDLENWNTDRSVEPPVMVRGTVHKTSGGSWVYAGEDNPLPVLSDQKEHTDLEGLGIVSVGTTAVELVFSGTTEVIVIKGHPDNTGYIYVGKSDVTNTGSNAMYLIQYGESIVLKYNDVDEALYVVSDTASQQVIAGALYE